MLLGNGSVLQKLPLRFLGGSTTSVEVQLRTNFNKPGMNRNRFFQDGSNTALDFYSIPEGTYAGVAWVLPQGTASMCSLGATQLLFQPSASGTMGLPTSGGTSFAIDVDFGIGSLIASGGGESTFTITTNSAQLVASLAAVGSSTITFTTSTPLLGALVFSEASVSFGFSSSLVPYAIGQMVGNTAGGAMTADSIAQAVWASNLEGTFTAGQIQTLIAAILAGKVSGAGTNAPIFRNLSDTKNRVTATTDSSGNRASVVLDLS
jgi:hypothetical protein